jgi:hypothetical protein
MPVVVFKKCSLIMITKLTLAEAKSLFSMFFETPTTLNCAVAVS